MLIVTQMEIGTPMQERAAAPPQRLDGLGAQAPAALGEALRAGVVVELVGDEPQVRERRGHGRALEEAVRARDLARHTAVASWP